MCVCKCPDGLNCCWHSLYSKTFHECVLSHVFLVVYFANFLNFKPCWNLHISSVIKLWTFSNHHFPFSKHTTRPNHHFPSTPRVPTIIFQPQHASQPSFSNHTTHPNHHFPSTPRVPTIIFQPHHVSQLSQSVAVTHRSPNQVASVSRRLRQCFYIYITC